MRAIAINMAGILIGGSFTRVGGGFSRDDVRNQYNITQLVGGETEGPGNIQLVQDSYSVDENTGELYSFGTNKRRLGGCHETNYSFGKSGTGLASWGRF